MDGADASPVGLDDFSAGLRRERAARMLLPLFFVSGATALAYQTIWARDLHLVFGTSTFAIATVLAAFMCGLAIGGFAMGRWADNLDRPLAIYGWIEIGIGLYALVFPFLLQGLTPVYLGFWTMAQPSPVVFGAVQFVLVGATLLLPTMLMGATLPLLARFATDRLASAGDRVGTLYAVNTAGAVFGTWVCGFVLLPSVGLWVTTLLAAAANLVLGVLAVALDRWSRGAELADVRDDIEAVAFDPRVLPVAVAAGLAGFAALAYEVTWTRVLGLMLGASVYGFSIMLLAFLIGIAMGGWIGGRWADRLFRGGGQARLLGAMAAVQIGVGLLSWALLFLFPELPVFYVQLYGLLQAQESQTLVWVVGMSLAVLVMTPPAVLMGVAFPMAVRSVIGRRDALGRPVGMIYGFNTAGSVLGASFAGFLLLPNIEIGGTVVVAVSVNLLGAVLLLLWARRLGWAWGPVGGVAGAIVAVAALVTVFSLLPESREETQRRQLMLTAGMYKEVRGLDSPSRAEVLEFTLTDHELLYYREGLSSVVTVGRNTETNNIWLANNGKVEASTTVDMPTQLLVSLLPFQYVDKPDNVLVIGLASGITAGSVTRIDDVKQLDIVELEPAIEPAARLFADHNHHVLDDPRVNLIFNDGRNHLLLTDDATYDVVISEPSNPWISGVSNLFTLEFLQMGKKRLRKGGVWSQWVQLYGMDQDDLRSLIGTFAEVYPHVLVFMTVEDGDLVMLGSEEPMLPSEAALSGAFERWPRMRAELALVGLDEPTEFLSIFQMHREQVLEFAGDIQLNTDDNMRIEYGAPLHMHASTASENVEQLLNHAVIPDAVTEPVDLLTLAKLYTRRLDWGRGMAAVTRAFIAAGAEPAPVARIDELLEQGEWEQAMQLAVRVGNAIEASDHAPEGWGLQWAGWRVAMLQYFGGDVPDDLRERAGLPPDEPDEPTEQ